MALSFFSGPANKSNSAHSDIPDNIINAVSVMGDMRKEDASKKAEEKEASRVPKATFFHHTSAQKKNTPQSPFLSDAAPVSPAKSPVSEVIQKPVSLPIPSAPRENGLTPAVPGLISIEKPKKSKRWLFILLGVVLFVGVGVALTWYFMRPMEELSAPAPEDQVIEQSSPLVENPVITSPFSLETPNYLSLDTETATLEDMRKTINQAGSQILEAKVTEPVEFVLTDKNNNPLAFSRLAFLANMEIGEELLGALDEEFSIFLYNDAGKIQKGVLLNFSDKEEITKLVKAEEARLPLAFQNLFYENLTVPRNAAFRSGTYNSQEVRFVNIDTESNASFDYAVREEDWIIGTSKNALRVILDQN